MKFFLFFPFLLVLLVLACKKDPLTLNDKLEGSWRVTYYEIFGTPWPPDITNGIAFKSEGTTKGKVWWAEHRDFAGKKDTAIGSYILDETAGSLSIKWKDVLHPYGMTKDATYDISLISDTLTLMRTDTFDFTVTSRSVRN